MRTIDADALKELFSEVIGHIAKKPEMNGNLEHMIRASAMVIQMIDDAPTVQPYTTTHDSIPAETGKNDGDETSGDCISRQRAIDALKEKVFHNLSDEFYGAMQVLDELPSVQPVQRWIPCSERQPDKMGDYLVTLWDDGRTWVEIALWNETFGGHWQAVLYNDVDYSNISNVIAWKPLPEPYQEGGKQNGTEK